MRVRACIRCDAALEPREVTIADKTHRAWVRVCHCEGVSGAGWYWRNASDPVAPPPVHLPPAAVDTPDDDIPAFDDPIPPKPTQQPGGFDFLNTAEPLTERRPA